MRQPLVAGNWKMHGSRDFVNRLLGELVEALPVELAAEVVVCPPLVYLAETARCIAGSTIMVGAQTVCAEADGAYTGEVSATMLKDMSCRYVIVGHSERRTLYGESDKLIARKFMAAQKAGLVPILCVGETLQQREAGITDDVVGAQLGAVLEAAGIDGFAAAVIAYEPVWAIGTGKTATPDEAQAVHALIRRLIGAEDDRIAAELRIVYGGSVKAANAGELFAKPDIDGGLIGGASLEAEEFVKICTAL
jgi:triosephosphate isomerase